jgi:serine/threonine protein kinase
MAQSTFSPCAALEDSEVALPPLAPPEDYPFLAPAQGPDEMGRLGPYLVQKVLGIGAMGVVFQAEDLHLKRPVALKVMKPALAAFPEFHRRFLREAQLAAAIDHEHVVTIYQVGEDRGVPYLAMKLLQGETLEDRLNRVGGRLPLPEVLRIGREVAEGLGAAHERGLVHRDVKPANVWLEANTGRVKIVDFGLARGTGADAHFTQAGAVIGTPSYMAPEQANGEEVDCRCDLFGLGAVLYRASTGELPFGGKDTLSVMRALATTTPQPPHVLVPSLPRAFSGLTMRMLAKERDDRPPSAREVIEAIEAIEQGAAPVSPSERACPLRSRKQEEAAPPSEPAAEEVPQRSASGTKVKRMEPKKARLPAARRKKRPVSETDWGRRVFVASLVLLVLGILVLVLGLVRYAARAGRAAGLNGTPHQLAERAGFEPAVRFDPHTAFPVAHRVGSFRHFRPSKRNSDSGLRRRHIVNRRLTVSSKLSCKPEGSRMVRHFVTRRGLAPSPQAKVHAVSPCRNSA